MKVTVESVQLVGTTYFTKETLDQVSFDNERQDRQGSYLEKTLQIPSVKHELEDDAMVDDYEEDEYICGICQISFSRHCCHCTVPSEIRVDEGKIVDRIDIGDGTFIRSIANVHNGCSLAKGICGHYFHFHCIEKWLGVPDASGKCPMCRQAFVEYK